MRVEFYEHISLYTHTQTQYAELKRHAKYLIHRSIILVMINSFTKGGRIHQAGCNQTKS